MKVLVVATLYPLSASDSTGVFVRAQVDALEDLGLSVRVIVPVPFALPGMGRRRARWKARAGGEDPGVLVLSTLGIPRNSRISAPMFGRLGTWQATAAHREVERWLDGWTPDVVHAHQVLPEGQFATTLAERFGWSVPVVSTIHGADLHSTRSGSRHALIDQMKRLDRVITATSSMKDRIASIQPDARVAVIPPGLPDREIGRNKEAPLRWDVVSVGRLVPIKAMERLFPVAASGHSVAIAGDGPERTRLEAFAPSAVEFVGAIAPSSVSDFIRSGRVYAQLSRWDGYGLAAAEAMGCGRPVILSDTVGLSEYVTNGVDGLVVRGSAPEEILAALNSLLDDRDHAIRLGDRGRELIASHSVSNVAVRLIDEVYRNG